jgi:ribonuclease D
VTHDELVVLADEVRRAGRLAIDTEFVWERTYRPVLGVVQVATDTDTAIIDATVIADLSPLFPLLTDPLVPVVMHGGGQDLEILAFLMGEPIRGVVDTQVVAAFLGYGLQIGLGVLLERVLKIRIRKDQTYTDWTRRPLRPEQLVYAREDVLHMLPLYDRLRERLEERGRVPWVEEELRALEDPTNYTPMPDSERFRTVKGWQRLSGRELAVLQALAAWRERAAQRANVRPGFIANDAVMMALTVRPPENMDELRHVRGLTPGSVERHGKGILAAVRDGRACPPEKWPTSPERQRRPAPPTGLGALLRAAVQGVADREEIAPEVIASTRDIEALIAHVTGGSKTDGGDHLPLVQGWRGHLVGDTLVSIAKGEIAMRYDPGRREVVQEAVDGSRVKPGARSSR